MTLTEELERTRSRAPKPSDKRKILAQGLIWDRSRSVRNSLDLAFMPEYPITDKHERRVRAQGIRSMLNNFCVGEVMVDGRFMRVAYNGNAYHIRDIGTILNQLFRNERVLCGTTCFNLNYLRETNRQFRENPLPSAQTELNRVTAWIDYEHGLFWTTESFNISDIRHGVRAFVEANQEFYRGD